MPILQPKNKSGKSGGYVTLYGSDDRPELFVSNLKDIRRIAREACSTAVLVNHFDDVSGGLIFRSPSDALRYRLGMAAERGDAAAFLKCDTSKHEPLGCFFIADPDGNEGESALETGNECPW